MEQTQGHSLDVNADTETEGERVNVKFDVNECDNAAIAAACGDDIVTTSTYVRVSTASISATVEVDADADADADTDAGLSRREVKVVDKVEQKGESGERDEKDCLAETETADVAAAVAAALRSPTQKPSSINYSDDTDNVKLGINLG